MTRLLAPALVTIAISASVAAAEPHKLLVMQSEGRADATLRARIDAAVVKLAAAVEPYAARGDITYSDAAAAVGCAPEVASCQDEVLGMLAVDEIVIVTVAPKPGGLGITVRRVGRAGATREATMVLPPEQSPDRLDALASVFAAPLGTQVPELSVPNAPHPPEPRPPAPRIQPVDQGRNRTLQLAGIAGGGAMTLIGLVLWTQASATQADIDSAPTRTHAELIRLRELEATGDRYAAWGNVCVIGGLVIGGISGYYFWRDRRARSHTALHPTVLNHGFGVALTIGGLP